MISVELAWGLVGVAAGASWRWSRLIAAALACVFLARLAYLQTHLELLRWVAIVPSAAGVYELASRADARRVLSGKRYANARALAVSEGILSAENIDRVRGEFRSFRVDLLALACIASSASDGAAAITHRLGLPWSLQYVQSMILLGMILVCAWPKKEAPS